ncbi:MAG: hypothetical protein DHS20C19_07370 [Acidimicrobiales bacterium]|nr:MAG: hypothetical protein DHS20C19_07370 [Acidimicrobiales bacterium]
MGATRVKMLAALLAAVVLLATGCGDDSSGDAAPDDPEVTDDGGADDGADVSSDEDAAADDSTDDDSTDDGDDGGEVAPPSDDSADDGGEDPPAVDPALVVDGNTVTVNWDAVTPTFIPPAAGSADPFFHIHSSNAVDGFYLSFEMYTVWGGAWTGETGTFAIGCNDQVADSGICVHFIPVSADGNDLGADFGATGSVTINQLDDSGYDLAVSGLTFSDGTTFDDFVMLG